MKTLKLVLGRYDDPEQQIQDDYIVDLYNSNIAVFGTSMSGKTTLLKTLLIRIHQMIDNPEKEEIYILDFNSNMGEYGSLPCVQACFDANNDENIRRIFKIVEDKLVKNIQKLEGKNYIQADENNTPNHITFILDGLNSFFSESVYMSYQERLQKIARNGLSKGISIVFAANNPSDGIKRLLSSFKHVIAFELPNDTYGELFPSRITKPILLRGRGICNRNTKVYEFHAYYPYDMEKFKGEDGENNALISFENQMKERYTERIYQKLKQSHLKSFSKNLDIITWGEYIDRKIIKKGILVAGINYLTFEAVEVDLRKAQAIAIYGKKKWGKSNLLRLLLYAALGIPEVRLVFWEDGREGLAEIEDVYKSFPEIGTEEMKKGYPSQKVFYDWEKFRHFMESEGYIKGDGVLYEVDDVFLEKAPPFTVFVIQSRLFYNIAHGSIDRRSITTFFELVENAETKNVLFIFSDVQKIMDYENREYFNNGIKHAFLMDDILRFVNDRGKNSVFGQQDPQDLKENFGKCTVGDSFHFDIEKDTISKFRMINVSDEKYEKGMNQDCLWKKIELGKTEEKTNLPRKNKEILTSVPPLVTPRTEMLRENVSIAIPRTEIRRESVSTVTPRKEMQKQNLSTVTSRKEMQKQNRSTVTPRKEMGSHIEKVRGDKTIIKTAERMENTRIEEKRERGRWKFGDQQVNVDDFMKMFDKK